MIMLRRSLGCLPLRLVRRDDGASLVEMAISLGIFLVFVLGTMEFSLYFLADNEVTDAARAAVRWAAVRGANSCANVPSLSGCNASSSEIQTYVQNIGYPMLVPGNIQVTTAWCQASTSVPVIWSACSASTSNEPGNQVQVTVSYGVPIFIPLMSNAVAFFTQSTTINASSTSSMVVAQ